MKENGSWTEGQYNQALDIAMAARGRDGREGKPDTKDDGYNIGHPNRAIVYNMGALSILVYSIIGNASSLALSLVTRTKPLYIVTPQL